MLQNKVSLEMPAMNVKPGKSFNRQAQRELTSCKVDEDGTAIHERCYLLKLSKKPAPGNEYS